MSERVLYFLDTQLLYETFRLNIFSTLLLFIVAYILFDFLPSRLFPQKYAGIGLEKKLSNILYSLAFIETVVPLMIIVNIFSLFMLLSFMLFIKFYLNAKANNTTLKKYFYHWIYNTELFIYRFLDNPPQKIIKILKSLRHRIFYTVAHLTLFKILKFTIFSTLLSLIFFTLGLRCFLSLSTSQIDLAQFAEWISFLHQNELYPDQKSPGPDFYGLSILLFTLQTFSNIDTIVLLNIFPLLLIGFLIFGIYFFVKKLTFSWSAALLITTLFSVVLIGSPLNQFLISHSATLINPKILEFFGLKFYTFTETTKFDDPAFSPFLRYFSGLPYEIASTFYLINLYYLIRTIRNPILKHKINYTLSLYLVFVFHGGGAIALLIPSLLIVIHATFNAKIPLKLLKEGILIVLGSAILGSAWMLSILKYGLPPDIGAAAPFLDDLIKNQRSIKRIIEYGIESVTISQLLPIHAFLSLYIIGLYFVVNLLRGWYWSSFLLISSGGMLFYLWPNLGLGVLAKPERSAEYFLLSLIPLMACSFNLFIQPIKKIFKFSINRLLLPILYLEALLLSTIPHYNEDRRFLLLLDPLHYSHSQKILHNIIRTQRPLTWTVVAYLDEYPYVRGKGYFINSNEFVYKYDPTERFLKIPTQKIYIFIEDIYHTTHIRNEWFYRWRNKIMENLKAWIAIYSSLHTNIKLFQKYGPVSVYEIDNREYLDFLQKKE